jgi:uncharacterized protein (TIGR00730 family)
MAKIERLTVYCGSSPMVCDEYLGSAKEFGREMARRGIVLVYGGAKIGLMGALADSVLQAGGEVIGVMPNFLDEKEIAHGGLSQLILVHTMHERKAKLASLGDGFVALPGGLGTLEEWFEALTWAQLGQHNKPCALLNFNGYYDDMLKMLRRCCADRFVRQEQYDMIISESQPAPLLDAMEAYTAPQVEKWLKKEEI